MNGVAVFNSNPVALLCPSNSVHQETCEDGSSRLFGRSRYPVLGAPVVRECGDLTSRQPASLRRVYDLVSWKSFEESLDQSQVSEDSVMGMTVFGGQMLQLSDPSY